jgi:hypothetical protein
VCAGVWGALSASRCCAGAHQALSFICSRRRTLRLAAASLAPRVFEGGGFLWGVCNDTLCLLRVWGPGRVWGIADEFGGLARVAAFEHTHTHNARQGMPLQHTHTHTRLRMLPVLLSSSTRALRHNLAIFINSSLVAANPSCSAPCGIISTSALPFSATQQEPASQQVRSQHVPSSAPPQLKRGASFSSMAATQIHQRSSLDLALANPVYSNGEGEAKVVAVCWRAAAAVSRELLANAQRAGREPAGAGASSRVSSY